jgi:drug/metabolite transporter (DMT)-like permease
LKKIDFFWHILAVITVFIWGTTFVSTKYLLGQGFGAVEIMVIRFIIAYTALFLIHPVIKRCSFKEEIIFFAMGTTGGIIYFLAENRALQITSASNVAMIVSTTPLLTAILAHFLTDDEKIHKKMFVGFIVAISGIACVVLNGKFILKLNPLGDFLALISALSWAFYSIILKKTGKKYNLFFVTRKMILYSLLGSIPIMILVGERVQFTKLIHLGSLLNFLFLGVIASALCFVIWQNCINRIGMVTASGYIYLSPMVTIITAVIFINEKITVFSIIGCIMIIAGVWIFNKKI